MEHSILSVEYIVEDLIVMNWIHSSVTTPHGM